MDRRPCRWNGWRRLAEELGQEAEPKDSRNIKSGGKENGPGLPQPPSRTGSWRGPLCPLQILVILPAVPYPSPSYNCGPDKIRCPAQETPKATPASCSDFRVQRIHSDGACTLMVCVSFRGPFKPRDGQRASRGSPCMPHAWVEEKPHSAQIWDRVPPKSNVGRSAHFLPHFKG